MPRLAALLLLAVVCAPAWAQDADAARADHRALAEEFLVLAGTEAAMEAATASMLDAQLKQNPAMLPYRDVFEAFFAEHLSWDAVKDELVTLYADRFSEAELREAIAFYSTPTGQRIAEEAPDLMQQGMRIGQRRAEENQDQLVQMIMKREQALRDGDATPPKPPPPDADGQ